MKKLRIVTKSLLFLSFFLPFIVFPTCCFDNHRAQMQLLLDSLRRDSLIKDSIVMIEARSWQKFQDSIGYRLDSAKKEKTPNSSAYQHYDSLNNDLDLKQNLSNAKIDSIINLKNSKKSTSSYLSDLWTFLIFPADDSMSGFGVSVLLLFGPFEHIDSFELNNLLGFILPLSFLLIFGSLIIQFFKFNLKKLSYLSVSSFVLIFIFGIQAEWKDLLWGFYIALLLNLLDIIVIYWSIRKEKLIRSL